MRRHVVMLVPLVALLSQSPASAQIFGSVGIGQTKDDAAERFPIAYRTPAASRNTLIEAVRLFRPALVSTRGWAG